MVNNDHHVADDHGRSRLLETCSLILSEEGDPLIQMTSKVQNSYQNLVRRSNKALDSLIVLQLFDPVDHQELIS